VAGELEGKVVIVTGAGSGIGKAAAFVLARMGAALVLGDIDGPAVAETAAAVGPEAVGMTCNVTVEDDVAALVELARSRWGRLDGAFNNVGRGGMRKRLVDMTMDEWRKVQDVTLDSVFSACAIRSP
jgi:NAD(P)-dependent dehydrogenase (short-subunit alcohol dehydrogenase family)